MKLEYFQKKKGKGLTSILDKVFNHEQLKILTPKKMLQRLGKKSENVLNEIRQIKYSSYWEKWFTKKVCKNIENSINL